MGCLNCGNELVHTPGKKPKKFCNTSCRSNFGQKKKRKGNGLIFRKPGRPKKGKVIPEIIANIEYVTPDFSAYNSSKLPDTTIDEAGKYATGIDPHSKGPSKGKISIYKKKQSHKQPKFVLTENGLIGVPELPHERQNNFKEVWEPTVKDPVSLDLPALVRDERQKSIADQIKAIKAEKVPKERDTSNGRKSWAFDQQKRIKELETKLK